MGHSQSSTTSSRRLKTNKPRWRDVPNIHSKPSFFPTPKQWKQFLLTIDPFIALGPDVCALIASYLECFCEDGIVTANGYVNHPKLTSPLQFSPPFTVPASCSCMLPPYHIAFGTTLPGEHRAAISVYNAHTLQFDFNLLFPMQSASDFIAPSPSVSSMLLVPFSTGSSIFDNSPCVAALDELGNLLVWRVKTQELLYTFNTKSPVFYSFSSLSLMPFSRLGLLLSGTPGPSRPSSRLVVFDLTTGETHKCSVDTLNSGVAFPVTFFVPSVGNSPLATSSNANRDPYCLYTDHSLCKWRMMYGTPELILAQTDWQWFNLREWRGEENREWKYKYRSERILSTAGGTILRVEGTLQTIRVWIGSHTDRSFWSYFEYDHEFDVKEEIIEPPAPVEETKEDNDLDRHYNNNNNNNDNNNNNATNRNLNLNLSNDGYNTASPQLCSYNFRNLHRILSLDDSDTLSESDIERKMNNHDGDDDEKQNTPISGGSSSSRNLRYASPRSLTSSPVLHNVEPSTDEDISPPENATHRTRRNNLPPLQLPTAAGTAVAANANVLNIVEPPAPAVIMDRLRQRRRGRQRRLPRAPNLQISATFMKENKIAIASLANNGSHLLRVWELIPTEKFHSKDTDIKMMKEEGCLRARCTYTKSFLSDPYRDHSILTQNSAPRIGLRHKEPFNLFLGSSW
jgi:hypothetical protein